MDIKDYYLKPGELPLDSIPASGGFTGIFRTIGCVGDSLSSGEFESLDKDGNRGYHDMYEYSWGQYIARDAGCKVYNFSRGGMSAKWYMDTYADENDFWNPDKKCQAYIFALGENDLFGLRQPVGDICDINAGDYTKNAETFCGYYARIIQRLKQIQPKARFFLMTMPKTADEYHNSVAVEHAALLYKLAEYFEFTYVIDLYKYAPVYDAEFTRRFFLGGHMNAAGYLFTSRITEAYIDYIIRANPDDFSQVGFIGSGYFNCTAKW